MLRIDQIVSQYEEALDITTADTDFTYDYYVDLTNQQRALHIRNEQNKRSRTFDDTIVQTIGCLPMKVVNSVLCCGEELTDCVILRSVSKLPDTVEFHDKDGIISVGSPQLTHKKLNHVDYQTIPYRGSNKISAKEMFSFIMDGYLYLYSKRTDVLVVKYVMVRGVFEDPLALEAFQCSETDASPCFNKLTSDYPMSSWMWESLVKPGVLRQLMTELGIPKDTSNDNRDREDEPQNAQAGRQQRSE
jgi:hypothetical protein